jgi:7 transmembrane receptor (rhodopsin family)
MSLQMVSMSHCVQHGSSSPLTRRALSCGRPSVSSTVTAGVATTSTTSVAVGPTPSETRAAKGIAVIVALFVVSWLPLYTVNTLLCFCPDCVVPLPVIDGLVVLSHCNSAWNPAVYAWGMRDFRSALYRLVCGAADGNGNDGIGGPTSAKHQMQHEHSLPLRFASASCPKNGIAYTRTCAAAAAVAAVAAAGEKTIAKSIGTCARD